MRRRQRISVLRGCVDGRSSGSLCGKPTFRLDLEDALAKRPHDSPAAHVGTEADRQPRCDLHPGWYLELLQIPVGEERERDHAHCLLRVVRTVRERHERPGYELSEPEAAIAHAARDLRESPIDQ